MSRKRSLRLIPGIYGYLPVTTMVISMENHLASPRLTTQSSIRGNGYTSRLVIAFSFL